MYKFPLETHFSSKNSTNTAVINFDIVIEMIVVLFIESYVKCVGGTDVMVIQTIAHSVRYNKSTRMQA